MNKFIDIKKNKKRSVDYMVNMTKMNITTINKYIDKYRKEQQRLLKLVVSNKSLIETRDGLKAILQVVKGDINEID